MQDREQMSKKNDSNIVRYITSKQVFMKVEFNKQSDALSAQIEALKERKETASVRVEFTARFRAEAASEG